METRTLGFTPEVNLRGLVTTSGAQVPLILGTLKEVSSMAKVNGKKTSGLIATSMKASLRMTRSKASVFSCGSPAIGTVGTTRRTREQATVRCIGTMVVYTRVFGIRAFKRVMVF